MKINTFIVCDDIRHEIGNKVTLVGVFGQNLNFLVAQDNQNIWPKSIRLCIYAEIEYKDTPLHSFKFTIKNNKEKMIIGEGIRKSEISHPQTEFKFTLNIPNYQLKEPGTIEFIFDFFDINKKHITSLNPNFSLKVDESVIK